MSLQGTIVGKVSALEKERKGSRRVEIQKRGQHAWSHACSTILALPGLRGFWPMSSFNESGNAYDMSEQGRVLTYNGNPTYNYDDLAPYIDLDGTGDYLSRADEAGTSITGTETYVAAAVRGITCGAWFYSTDTTNQQFLIAKDTGAAGGRSYALAPTGNLGGDPIRFLISDDGTNISAVDSTTGYTSGVWRFAAGRFNDNDAGAELAVWSNGEQTTAATAMASIHDNASNFTIGALSGGALLLTGAVSMAFLCAVALSDDIIAALYAQTRALYGV
jgi:hypothetical protein